MLYYSSYNVFVHPTTFYLIVTFSVYSVILTHNDLGTIIYNINIIYIKKASHKGSQKLHNSLIQIIRELHEILRITIDFTTIFSIIIEDGT